MGEIMKVKTLGANNIAWLDNQINEFVDNEKINVKEIKFQVSFDCSANMIYHAMVIYEKNPTKNPFFERRAIDMNEVFPT